MINPAKFDFVDTLQKLLVLEYGYTEDNARTAVRKCNNLVVQGIMNGRLALRGTAMAIDHEFKSSQQCPNV